MPEEYPSTRRPVIGEKIRNVSRPEHEKAYRIVERTVVEVEEPDTVWYTVKGSQRRFHMTVACWNVMAEQKIGAVSPSNIEEDAANEDS